MKLVITCKDPFSVARSIPEGEIKEWCKRLTLALCNAHRQAGTAAYAAKFHFPLGKSGVPGLLEWIMRKGENYAWAARLLSSLENRRLRGLAGKERYRKENPVVIYLAFTPPSLVRLDPPRPPVHELNPLVPVGLSKASWIDYDPS